MVIWEGRPKLSIIGHDRYLFFHSFIILFEVGLEGKFFSSTTKLLSVTLFILISVSVLLSRLKKDEDCNLLSTRKWF